MSLPLRPLATLALSALLTAGTSAQVAISEILAANRNGLRDAEGLTADWVELHNLGESPEPLAGRVLADDRGRRFVFPDVALAPRGYLVVYLTGKLRRDPTARLHAGFRLGRGGGELRLLERFTDAELSSLEFGRQHDDVSFGHPQPGERVVLVAPCQQARFVIPRAGLPSEWVLADFRDRTWQQAQGGFGYAYSGRDGIREWIGTDIGGQMRGNGTTACFRYRFDASDTDRLTAALLRVHLVGGFVAWLNGTEIARVNLPAELLPDTRAWTWEEGADLRLVHEFEVPTAPLRDGENLLAVQSFSTSVFAFDHLVMAELVGFAPGELQRERLVHFATPSPGRPNGEGLPTVASRPEIREKPALGLGSRIFSLAAAGDGVVRYTTDGSDPAPASAPMPDRLELEVSAELRVRRFVAGELPSPVDSVHFTRLAAELQDYESDLPMIVVSTHGTPVETKQWIEAHVHAIDRGANGTSRLTGPAQVSTHGSIRLRGSSTLNLPKRSYALELHRPSGRDREVPLFGLAEAAEWVLYAPHNYDQSHLRNALSYEIARRMGVPAPRWRFCELFVDTDGGSVTAEDYKGLYLLVEKIEVGKERVDIDRVGPTDNEAPEVTGGYILKIDRPGVGDTGFTAGGQALQFVSPTERNITDPQRAFLQRWFDGLGTVLGSPEFADPERGYPALIDVDSFIDYHFFHEYTKNPDAYTLSTYMHLPRGGRLRMGPVWDFDRGMRTNDDQYWVGRGGRPLGWTGDYQYGWWGTLFRDPAFVARYRERGRNWLATELAIPRIQALVREIAAEIERAEERDRVRWPIIEAGRWHVELAELEDWIVQRTQWLREELVDLPIFTTPTTFEPPFTLSMHHDNRAGTLYYTTDGADPKLDDGRLSPRAKVYDGPIAVDGPMQVRARVLADGVWSRITERSFVREIARLAISEIMYDPEEGHREEFIEFWNYGDTTIDMTGIDVDGGIRYHFGMGAVKTLAPGARVLIVNDLDTFLASYDAVGLNIAGEFLGQLSNTEDRIVVRGSVGELVCRVAYSDDWYPETDGKGRSLVLRAPGRICEAKTDWRASDVDGGTPGR